MNARLLAAFLCLTVASTGCIIVDNGGGGPPAGQPGDVTFLWTFANAGAGRCADVPDVKKVRITIPGETLLNGGVYACNTAGVDGIVLHDFVPGSYGYTIEALDYTDAVLYRGGGNFTVNGDVRVNVDLSPGGQSYAYISWDFPPNSSSSNPSCAQANVTSLKVQIDNGDWVALDCQQGMSNGGVASPYLDPGQHTINLVAYGRDSAGRDGMPLYTAQGTFTTTSGSPISASFGFDAVGGLSLRWDLWDGYQDEDCTQAGLTGMVINLRNKATGELVYGTAGDPQACTGAPVVYQFLAPGDYDVYIHGMSGSTLAYSNDSSPTTVTVRAFVQKTAADPSTTIVLDKQ